MDTLAVLAEHNAWANDRVFAACARLPQAELAKAGEAYQPVLGILEHLVQVEHVFFELAHGRPRSRIAYEGFGGLRELSKKIDDAYIGYARDLKPSDADTKRFLVPWFGFEVTLLEGILQPLTHAHKHRADVSMLLPRLGGEGVEMDLIQWIAESRPAAD